MDTALSLQKDVEDSQVEQVGSAKASGSEDQDQSHSSGKKKKKKSKSGNRRRRRGKGTAKAKATPHKSDGPETASDWKKCGACSKWKNAHEDFNRDQKNCKGCFNHKRSLFRVAETQGCKKEVQTMETNDPKQFQALLKDFIKKREVSSKSGDKLRFSIQSFKISFQSREGERKENEGEMMWEQEYLEWAKTAKAGYLSPKEAQENWDMWKANPEWPRDENGPRGFLRLYVHTKDKLIGFAEVAKQKEYTKEEKLGKNASKEQIEARLRFVVGGQGLEKHEACDFEELRRKAKQSFARDSDQQSVLAEGILAPEVNEMIDSVKSKGKRTSGAKPPNDGGEGEEEEDESQEGGEEEKDQEHQDSTKPKKGWFDQESQTNKAERTFKQQCQSLRGEMQKTQKEVMDTLSDFKADKAKSQDFVRAGLLFGVRVMFGALRVMRISFS